MLSAQIGEGAVNANNGSGDGRAGWSRRVGRGVRLAMMVALAIAFGHQAAIGQTAQVAAEWPTKPIRFIVPYPPGGGTDIIARIVQERLSAALGQPIVIDNRGGAAGNIGTDLAAKAAPDGYTFLFTLSSHTLNPVVYDKLPFDVEKDFMAVSMVASLPQILTAHPSAPFNDLPGMVAYAQANPGKLNYASVGNGSPSHIAGELLKLKTGIDMVHVPYKGGGPAVTANLGGEVQLMFVSIPPALQHVKAGKLKALGVTTLRRTPAAPEIPTVAEAGVPGFENVTWYGMFAPAKTPQEVIVKLNAQVVKILTNPEMAQRMASQGAEPRSTTPEELAGFMRVESARWKKVIKAAGIKLE